MKETKLYHCTEGKSNKFWEISWFTEGKNYIARWGKIGTAGQEKQSDFYSTKERDTDLKKLISSKEKKGYVEKFSSSSKKEKLVLNLEERKAAASFYSDLLSDLDEEK